MRVVLLTRSLEAGGAERQLLLLARGLRARGHEVALWTFYGGGSLAEERGGVPLLSLEKRGRWDGAGFVARLRARLKSGAPDVLYSFLTVPNVVAALACPPGTSLVWGVRVSAMDLGRYGLLHRAAAVAERLLARRADLVVANAWSGRRALLAAGVPREKVRVVPNGIDTDRFHPDPAAAAAWRRRWGVGPEEPLVGMVARPDPMKDHGTFFEALSALPGVRAVLAGGGRAEAWRALRRRAEAAGVAGRILWAGLRPTGELRALYGALDVLVLSSRFGEGFPNVVGEAMACGTPCVVTRVGDAPRVVGDTGGAVPPGDPAALAAAVARLLGEGREDRLARGRRARERVRRYSVGRMVGRTEALLQAVRRGRA